MSRSCMAVLLMGLGIGRGVAQRDPPNWEWCFTAEINEARWGDARMRIQECSRWDENASMEAEYWWYIGQCAALEHFTGHTEDTLVAYAFSCFNASLRSIDRHGNRRSSWNSKRQLATIKDNIYEVWFPLLLIDAIPFQEDIRHTLRQESVSRVPILANQAQHPGAEHLCFFELIESTKLRCR